MEQKPKVSRKKILEALQDGMDKEKWVILDTGGTPSAMLKPLVEYLRKAGIDVV